MFTEILSEVIMPYSYLALLLMTLLFIIISSIAGMIVLMK